MKRVFLICIGFVSFIRLLADIPGNTPRSEVTVLVLLGDLDGFAIYSNGPYASNGDDKIVADSSEILLNGGFGEPPCVTFFGVNKNDRYTDSVFICNQEQGDVVLKLRVVNGKLVSEEMNQPVKEETVPLITSPGDSGRSGHSFFRKPINVLVISAFVSMIMLVGWYFITHRKKQEL
jgi:hypothetical protein